MPWMRRFATIWSNSQSHLAIAREWLALAWGLIGGPKGFAPLLNDTAMQKKLRWMLRLSEAVLRLAITKRAKAIPVPPLGSVRRRLGGGALLPPLDRPDAPYAARFRLDAPDDRWAIRPPAKAPSTRRPRQPIALLFRLLACQDGLDRFEILARKEARRWRRAGGGINCGGGGAALALGENLTPIHHATGDDEAEDDWHPSPAWIPRMPSAQWDDAKFAATTPLPWEDCGRSAAAPEGTRRPILHTRDRGDSPQRAAATSAARSAPVSGRQRPSARGAR